MTYGCIITNFRTAPEEQQAAAAEQVDPPMHMDDSS
jgi:hypothetical protein